MFESLLCHLYRNYIDQTMVHFPVQEALKRKLKARMEYAIFLQDTAKEMAKEVQTSRSGDIKQTAEDLDEFLDKVWILSVIQSLLVMHCKLPLLFSIG